MPIVELLLINTCHTTLNGREFGHGIGLLEEGTIFTNQIHARPLLTCYLRLNKTRCFVHVISPLNSDICWSVL